MKRKKSLTTRIRVTRRGKIVRRKMGLSHFRTRTTQKNIRNKRKTLSLNHPLPSNA